MASDPPSPKAPNSPNGPQSRSRSPRHEAQAVTAVTPHTHTAKRSHRILNPRSSKSQTHRLTSGTTSPKWASGPAAACSQHYAGASGTISSEGLVCRPCDWCWGLICLCRLDCTVDGCTVWCLGLGSSGFHSSHFRTSGFIFFLL